MPETKFQKFIFTLLMAFFMVGFMASYNVFPQLGVNALALHIFLIKASREYLCAVPIAFLFGSIDSGALAHEYCPKKFLKYFPLFISFFTPFIMVPLMTTVVALLDGLFALPLFELLARMQHNFIFALPIQLLVAGPAVRTIFAKIKAKL